MLSETALEILKARYLRPGETPDEMFRRVAKAVSMGELLYHPPQFAEKWDI